MFPHRTLAPDLATAARDNYAALEPHRVAHDRVSVGV
jgi:hypothetical protein